MQTTLLLPEGYTRLSDGGATFDITRVGRPGKWDINLNDPLAVWEFTVSYVRQEYLQRADQNNPQALLEENERFNKIYSFFLNIGSSVAFLVDDPLDNTDSAMNGSGTVELLDGVWRLGKRYGGPIGYWHPITRPKPDVVLGGGAANGTLDPNTGVVSRIAAPGSWTGSFWRPMVFLNAKLGYEATPDGIIRAFSVPLQENLEL